MNAQASPAQGGGVPTARQYTSQGSGGPKGADDDVLNVAIMAKQAGSPKQPVENKGCLCDPASLMGLVTVRKGVHTMMVAC